MVGEIKRKSEAKVTHLHFSEDMLVCVDSLNNVEVWRVGGQEELARRILLSSRRK